MDIDLASGRYVLAVSGGVDSMVLLDVLRQRPDVHLVVAHFDHGIRDDSSEDRKLVQEIAKNHGLQFVYDEANLDPNASEAAARKARYDFLHTVREVSGAHSIITAHHQDDLIETVVLNLIRGTGRSGLAPLYTTDNVQRPLLNMTKAELYSYADQNQLQWHEDSTNQDTKYLRNYVRHVIIPALNDEQKQSLLAHIHQARGLNQDIDDIVTSMLHLQQSLHVLDRHWFIMLPHAVAKEIMKTWLERHEIRNIDRKLIERLVVIAKTSHPNRVADIDKKHLLYIGLESLKIQQRERMA